MAFGFQDKAVESVVEDQFHIQQYINGLCDFIKECETPMTIAIQGDWGSGKTSVMNMVRQQMKDQVIPVWFNTWQFSQFTMGEELAIVFLNYLCKELRSDEEPVMEKLSSAVSGLGRLAAKYVGEKSEQIMGSAVINDAINDKLEKSAVDIVNDLKQDFQKAVNRISEKNNGKRIVFYIDDLDRLQPLRAVELLEVLKNFLDCQNCVFVLAIDYEVVSQGIKEKYKNSLDERKSRKFFEKIIQVPFKMPVAHYNIDEYIATTLENLGISREKYSQQCANLIKASIGYNPRAMKRTFNAYLLLTKVHSGDQEIKSELGKLILFASLCMQLVYEDAYNYLVTHLVADEEYEDEFVADAEFFKAVLEEGITEENSDGEFFRIVTSSKEYDAKELNAFLQCFAELICKDKQTIDEGALKEMQDILQMASITSSKSIGISSVDVGKGARKEKVYDAEFKQCTVDALKKKEVRSFNAGIFEWYKIDGKITDCTQKFKFANFLVDAIEYAYAYDKEKFDLLRNRAIASSESVYGNLFCRERTSNPESYRTMECGYEISTHSNNNTKINQVQRFYDDMGIDCNTIIFSMKEAYDVKEGKE